MFLGDLPDLPPRLQERVVCSISAAARYAIPANILLAVAEKEGGRPGQWVRNKNGSHDVGSLQFNTLYLASLIRHGITADDVAASGCYPYELAAWRLRQHIKNDSGDLWTRVANYHSHTPAHNAVYRADLIVRAQRWADWLSVSVTTYDVTQLDLTTTKRSLTMSGVAAAAPRAMGKNKTRESAPGSSTYVPRRLVTSDLP